MFTCPKCGHTQQDGAAHEGRLYICGACGGTLFEPENGDPIRPANLEDLQTLTDAQTLILKKARRTLVQRFKPQ